MSAHPIDDLIRLWGSDDLTAEQAVGQVIQHIKLLHEELKPLRRAAGQVTKVDERLQRVERMLDAMLRAMQKERERR